MQVFCEQLPTLQPYKLNQFLSFFTPYTNITILSKTTKMKEVSISRSLCLSVSVMAMAIVALITGVRLADAVNCNPMEMRACLPAFESSDPPTAECCEKVKEQQPCFCAYLKSPIFKPYLESPNAKKIGSSCGVSFPAC